MLFGMLSQPLHKILNIYLFNENNLLKYEGFSTNLYEFILFKVNNELNVGPIFSSLIINATLTFLGILGFVYTASTSIKELVVIKKFITPFYLPFYWLIQLLNNLFVKKYYFNHDQEDFIQEKNKSLYYNFKNLINFFIRKKKIETKAPINVNKIISPEQKNDRPAKKSKNNKIYH